MRKSIGLVFLIVLSLVSCLIYVQPEESQTTGRQPAASSFQPFVSGEITFGYIYDYLSGFGFWVNYSPFGYVWVPRGIDARWHPYVHGRWIWSDYGWTWVSFYSWGWLPFHYGRWGWDIHLGWFWVPDVEWGPAWVVWRFSDIYIGWAPVPPNVRFRPGHGFEWRNGHIDYHLWVFIEGHRFVEGRLVNWVIPRERNRTLINFTVLADRYSLRNNIIINDALSPQHVERMTGRPINRVNIKEIKEPAEERVSMNEVRIYRPVIRKEAAAPKTAISLEETGQRLTPDRLRQDVNSINSYHRREQTLLDKTQKMEIEKLKQQTEKEIRVAPPQEKQRKLKELQARIEQLRQQHGEEKEQLLQRQAREKQSIKPENLRNKNH
ncbi:MAG TPA: hypothetical protein PLB50_00030 [Candidatus Saccharicenans sp.]|nr:hypothetical protein [Candidatus Saccharicenans sp.]HQO75057.1 hypothetical protein [Candidatus Saccharicenans sp.]HUM79038.1 hypothetical protein [Candidatus Saccharicenans sp.]